MHEIKKKIQVKKTTKGHHALKRMTFDPLTYCSSGLFRKKIEVKEIVNAPAKHISW